MMVITPEVVPTRELTPAESKLLSTLERKIGKGLKVFVEVGEALAAISDKRLYRQTHGNYADYCQDHWAEVAQDDLP